MVGLNARGTLKGPQDGYSRRATAPNTPDGHAADGPMRERGRRGIPMRVLTYAYLAVFALVVLLYVLSVFGFFVDPLVDPGM